MRVVTFLLGVVLFLPAASMAQGPAGVGAGSGSGRFSLSQREYQPWQISLGYQYNRDNLVGSPFNTDGANASVVRFFGRWIGAEVQVGAGFGHTGATTNPPNIKAQSVLLGAGPRLALRNKTRYEPWAHVVVGLEHFRFSQTAGVLGSNNALAGAAGGGLDILLDDHLAFRIEGDVLGSRFFSTNQRHFQAVSGLVLNF